MATLSPLALLVMFLALSAAPSSATDLRIYLPSFGPMALIRERDDWWVRQDDTGRTLAVKREGTSLVLRTLPDHSEARTDLAQYFDLTGREDLTRDATIRPKGREGTGAITTRVERGHMVLHVPDEVGMAAIITWNTPGNGPRGGRTERP
jgi:hypothetical protein